MELHEGVGKERDCYVFPKISTKFGFRTRCCTDSCPNPAAAAVDTALPGPGSGITCTHLPGLPGKGQLGHRTHNTTGTETCCSHPSLWGNQGSGVKIHMGLSAGAMGVLHA